MRIAIEHCLREVASNALHRCFRNSRLSHLGDALMSNVVKTEPVENYGCTLPCSFGVGYIFRLGQFNPDCAPPGFFGRFLNEASPCGSKAPLANLEVHCSALTRRKYKMLRGITSSAFCSWPGALPARLVRLRSMKSFGDPHPFCFSERLGPGQKSQRPTIEKFRTSTFRQVVFTTTTAAQ